MKIKRNSKKLKLIVIVSLLLVAIAVTGTALALKIGPFAAIQTGISNSNDPASADESKESSEAKQRSVKDSQDGKTQTGSDPAPDPTPIPGSSKSSVSLDIPSVIQNDSLIRISSIIQAVVNNGTCTLTMTMSGHESYTTTTGVQALSSNSTCTGFDVPTSELAPGNWTATIEFNNDTLQGSGSKEIMVQ